MTSHAQSHGSALFADLTHTPQQSFTLYFYAAVLRLAHQAALHFGSPDAAHERLPFIAGYVDQIARLGLEGSTLEEAAAIWRDATAAWERASPVRLPLVALRANAGLEHDDLVVLAAVGLPAEDARFGMVFDALQGGIGERHATRGLLGAGAEANGARDARIAVNRLLELGLVEAAPGDNLALRPCAAAWEAVRGTQHGGIPSAFPARFLPRDDLPVLERLVLPNELRAACERLHNVLASGAVGTIVLRGLPHNGRRTLAAAVARELGKGVVAVPAAAFDGAGDPRWRTVASVACLLDAVVVTVADPAPSDTFDLPALPEGIAPLFVALSATGALGGVAADSAVTVSVPMPDRAARDRLWQAAVGADGPSLSGLRMTSGNIMRAGRLALAARRVASNGPLDRDALRTAVRSLERRALDTLARRLNPLGDWSHLSLSSETLSELTTLVARCRQRERLGALAGEALRDIGPGIRALFKGASGTGKTLAARMLAGELEMDLYRLDLAAVVNKYIGETEKNLEKAFTVAEQLDVMLLLDEGDALLTQRTAVQSANDRYANLETNYLLQRLESYEGILLVATNAGDRIDSAFQRRMDVVIDFALPDAAERWAIWQVHLPSQHEVELQLLEAAVQRCALSGGQIRNIALHASLLAAENSTPVRSNHLETAIEREYRKQGAVSPMRQRPIVRGSR